MRANSIIEHIGIVYGAVIVRPIKFTTYSDGETPKQADFYCADSQTEFKVVVKFDRDGHIEEDYRTEYH